MPTDKQKKARNKWDAENMTNLACKIKKTDAERFREYAANHGTTVNALFLEYVRKCLESDTKEKESAE